jgi:formate dehydrogenase subunit delta
MDVHRLIKMANEIGAFFEAEPERAVALEGVANHIERFWEPRMRRELLRWVDEHDGQGLTELLLASIQANREKLTPQTTSSS